MLNDNMIYFACCVASHGAQYDFFDQCDWQVIIIVFTRVVIIKYGLQGLLLEMKKISVSILQISCCDRKKQTLTLLSTATMDAPLFRNQVQLFLRVKEEIFSCML